MTYRKMQKHVLLIGWGGADWQVANPLMEQGAMPQLANIVNNGVAGTLSAPFPLVTSMLWKTIATGKHPHQHEVSGAYKYDTRRCGSIWQMAAAYSVPAHSMAWPVPQGAVFPLSRAADLADLHLCPEDVDPRLIGLFIQEPEKLDEQRHGRVLQSLMTSLAELYSCHNAAVHILSTEPQGLFCIHYCFLDRIARDFMHPSVSNGPDNELFKDVINGAYRLQDVLLADLFKYTGQDCSAFVVSAHGRPGNPGMFAAAGRGIKHDELVHGAALADVVPTVLHHMGLPVGEDMDGCVLTDIFSDSSDPEFIPSWQPLIEGCEPKGTEFEPINESPARFSHVWNIGNAMFSLGRHLEALPYLEEAFFLRPDPISNAIPLIRCQLELGLLNEAEQTLEFFRDSSEGSVECQLIEAEIAHQRGELHKAWAHLDSIKNKTFAMNPFLRDLYGWLLLRVGNHDEAAKEFSGALASQRENPTAWLGLARAQFSSGNTTEAKECALQAIALQHNLPSGHLLLGKCREREKEFSSAAASYELALAIQPGLRSAEDGIMRCHQKIENPDGPHRYILSDQVAFPLSNRTSPENALQDAAKQRRQTREHLRDERRKMDSLSEPRVQCRLLIEERPIIIREPWSDERTSIHNTGYTFRLKKTDQVLVAVADAPERIVAIGAMTSTDESNHELWLHVCPRFQKKNLPEKLLIMLEKLAADKSLLHIILSNKNSWLNSLLKQAGYTMVQETELWHGVIKNMTERLAPLIHQIDRRLERRGLHLELVPLADADPEAVAMIATENKLLSRQRIYGDLSNKTRELKHDGHISCMAMINEKPAGISLVSRHNTNTVLFDARAVAKSQAAFGSMINAKMLFFFCQATAENGIENVLFFSNNTDWLETRSLAERSHCQCVGWQRQMAKTLNK